MRTAFLATVKDPATKKDASKRFLPMRYQTHKEVLSAIDKVFKKPPQAFATLAKMLGFDKPRKKRKKK